MANDHKDVSMDVLYSPSSWSTRLSGDVIVDNHIKVLHEGEELTGLVLSKCWFITGYKVQLLMNNY